MAVTQQLARLGEGLIDQCKRDVSRLDDLCSFRLLEPDDYLDLEWSPAILECAARVAEVSSARLSILELATRGGHELNPAYRDLPGSIWQQPVTVNSAAQVSMVHNALQALAGEGFPTAPAARTAVAQLGSEVSPTAASGYLTKHFDALNCFYSIAAARRLQVAMWWD